MRDGSAAQQVSAKLLRAALGEAEAERTAAAAAAAQRLERATAEAEAQLGLQEELCRLRVSQAEGKLREAQQARDWQRARHAEREKELRASLGDAAGQLHSQQQAAQQAHAAMQMLHSELAAVKAALPPPRDRSELDGIDEQIEAQLGTARHRLSVLLGDDDGAPPPPAAPRAAMAVPPPRRRPPS